MTTQNHLTGPASEYTAAAHFLAQGHQVWWPASKQSRADFVVEMGGNFNKVQVKTASWSKSGKYKYLQCRLQRDTRNPYGGSFYRPEDFDLLVIVRDSRIWLVPHDKIAGKTSLCLQTDNPKPQRSSRSYNPDDWVVVP